MRIALSSAGPTPSSARTSDMAPRSSMFVNAREVRSSKSRSEFWARRFFVRFSRYGHKPNFQSAIR